MVLTLASLMSHCHEAAGPEIVAPCSILYTCERIREGFPVTTSTRTVVHVPADCWPLYDAWPRQPCRWFYCTNLTAELGACCGFRSDAAHVDLRAWLSNLTILNPCADAVRDLTKRVVM